MNVETARVSLNTGRSIPLVGLGVWQIGRGEPTRKAVLEALRLGYRHIDTASIYGNEQDVGEAVSTSGLSREEIFVTTKLWNQDQGYDAALRAFDRSLARLRLAYVDLYLIHWPVPKLRLESWRALTRIHEEGRARAIGVSNFLRPHLGELLSASSVVPAVNQIEISPFLQHRETRSFCLEKGIAVEAYSPLTRGQRLDDPVVGEVARELRRTPAQVMLRWGIERGLVVLPKSKTPARIAENAAIFDFELGPERLSRLDSLEAGLATGWDPRDEA